MLKALLKQRRVEPRDFVIVVLGEKISILPVVEEDAQGVHTESQIFPRADLEQKFSPGGGVYYLAEVALPYLQETEHLKAVEENIAIKNIFDYGLAEKRGNMQFFIMAGLVALAFIAFMFK